MKRLLIVDDNETFLDSAGDVLEAEGFSVAAAAGGEEAIRRAREENFCVIVMDIKMGGLNGVETFIEMKKFRPDIKVIICTAHMVEDLIRQAEAEGVTAVLKKPFKTEVLLETIEEACRDSE
jgi:CheY-like chemotaxis protein